MDQSSVCNWLKSGSVATCGRLFVLSGHIYTGMTERDIVCAGDCSFCRVQFLGRREQPALINQDSVNCQLVGQLFWKPYLGPSFHEMWWLVLSVPALLAFSFASLFSLLLLVFGSVMVWWWWWIFSVSCEFVTLNSPWLCEQKVLYSSVVMKMCTVCCICSVVMVGAGAAIQIAEGSAAVGVELFPCLYDDDCNLGFVLGLCDVDVRSQGHVLFLTEKIKQLWSFCFRSLIESWWSGLACFYSLFSLFS
jgi:hypothetical protein